MRLPPDGQDPERALLTLAAVPLGDRGLGHLQEVRVERARQSAVARDHDEERAADLLALPEQRVLGGVEPLAEVPDHLADLERVRACGEDPLLGPAQLRRRHHLHGARDLLRVLDRADPAPDVAE